MTSVARRRLLLGLAGLLAWRHACSQADAMRRIAFPAIASRSTIEDLIQAFEFGLREHGLVNGRNIAIDYRFADGDLKKYREVVREAVRAAPEVILTGVNLNTAEVLAATRSIPIVMAVGKDVVDEGFVSSYARPGGNVTGLTWEMGFGPTLKRLELLKEAAPWISRVAVLYDPPYPGDRGSHEAAAGRLRLVLSWSDITDEFNTGFTSALRQRPDALYWLGGARQRFRHAEAIALSARHRLPASYHDPIFVERGGLMSYGPDVHDLFRRAAAYVYRILNGARPADLPVEQPTKFTLLLNPATAKELGIRFPQSLLLRADRIVE